MTAWLCLAIALMSGTLPARGFVLCIEADGCVRVELKSPDASCNGCDDHESSATATATEVASRDSGDSDCPCIDVAVPSCAPQQRILPKPIAVELGEWIAPLEQLVPQSCVLASGLVRGPPAEVPRPSESLVLIRSVVLRV